MGSCKHHGISGAADFYTSGRHLQLQLYPSKISTSPLLFVPQAGFFLNPARHCKNECGANPHSFTEYAEPVPWAVVLISSFEPLYHFEAEDSDMEMCPEHHLPAIHDNKGDKAYWAPSTAVWNKVGGKYVICL